MTRDGARIRATGFVLSALVGLGALAGCGDDDDGGGDAGSGEERQAYVDALVAASNAEDDTLTDEQDACFAESIVDTVGVERLAAAATPEEVEEADNTNVVELGVEVDEADGEEFYERVSGCVDLRELFIEEAVGSDELSDEAVTCLSEQFDDELIRDFMVAGFTQSSAELEEDTELLGRLQAVFTECAEA